MWMVSANNQQMSHQTFIVALMHETIHLRTGADEAGVQDHHLPGKRSRLVEHLLSNVTYGVHTITNVFINDSTLLP